MSDAANRLPSWIRAVDLDPGATRLEVVRGAAESLAKSPDEAAILDLVLLAHGMARGNAVGSVAAAMREHDEASVVNEGDVLAALTAAAAAAFALEGDVVAAVPFGLAIQSAGFVGLQPAVAELATLARAGLARASEAQRRRGKLSVVGANIDTALDDWPEGQQDQPIYGQDLNSAQKAVAKAAKAAAGVTSRALPPIARRFEALEEEVDVLWWVFGEFSEFADKPFRSVPENAAACLAGVELASRTARRAPLPTTRAILSRILQPRADKPTEIGRALPATVKLLGDEWVDQPPPGHPLLPVLSSLEEYRGVGRKAVWKESVAARLEVDPGRSTTLLDLAEQVVREVLLARVPQE